MAHQTTRALPPSKGPRVRLCLEVVEGEDAGRRVSVDAAVLVGTSELSDLCLSDPTVSRRHALLEPSELGLRVVDQESRNGTWIEECRLREAELREGTTVRMGGTTLRVTRDVATGPPDGEREAAEEGGGFGRFLGEAKILGPMYSQLRRAAASDATVLLEGESGSGKELLAEAIHEHSGRAGGPFVVVDCAAVPETLIESELFGHERGAFTGADHARAGAFEQAEGGTVFLDEIGELPLQMQTRLLRVLDRKQVQRLGSNARIDVDVRFVAATNRNLEREVEESRFRLDLFHRLAVVLVRVPPLRQRGDDVVRLARHLVRASGGDESLLSDEVLARLREHPWPGNVRELRNHVERLVLFGEVAPPGSATTDPLRDAARSGQPYRRARARVLEAFTEAYVADMLERHDGNVSRAAAAAGVARRHFQRLKSGDPGGSKER